MSFNRNGNIFLYRFSFFFFFFFSRFVTATLPASVFRVRACICKARPRKNKQEETARVIRRSAWITARVGTLENGDFQLEAAGNGRPIN